MNVFTKLLGIEDLDESLQSISKTYFTIDTIKNFTFSVAETFLVLYVLQFVSFVQLGILISVRYAIQSVLDYPTGVIADFVGYKKVLIIAFVGHFLSILTFIYANNFIGFLIAYSLFAISASQESGALPSWYDNLYEERDTVDEHRTHFGAFKGKVEAANNAIRGIAFILGGILSVLYSRRFLLKVELGCIVFLLILVSVLMEGSNIGDDKLTMRKYMTLLKGGTSFVFSDPAIRYYFLGIAMVEGFIMGIWFSQMIFPFYEAYSSTDSYTGLLRSLIYWTGVFWTLLAVKVSKKVTRESLYKSSLIAYLFAGPVFITILLVYNLVVPPIDHFDLKIYLSVILIFQTLNFALAMDNIFRARIVLQIVPPNIRNSVYSLEPTLVTLIGIPASLVGGYMINRWNFTGGFVLIIVGSLIGFVLYLKATKLLNIRYQNEVLVNNTPTTLLD